MNILTVDGQKLAAGDIAGNNLEEILGSLMEHPATSNRVIIQVMLNGSPYSEEMPHAALEVARENIESLELNTKTAEELSLHFLQHGCFFVRMLRQALPRLVEDFRLGDETEANEHFLSFLESLHLLINMLSQVNQAMNLGEEIEVAGQGSLAGFMEKLTGCLTSIERLQEQNDWIFLADILEYELDEALADLDTLLPVLNRTGH